MSDPAEVPSSKMETEETLETKELEENAAETAETKGTSRLTLSQEFKEVPETQISKEISENLNKEDGVATKITFKINAPQPKSAETLIKKVPSEITRSPTTAHGTQNLGNKTASVEEQLSNRGTKKPVIREKPKVRREDFEEFDTDEEDEEEEPESTKNAAENQTAYPPDYSKHLTYEGDLCIYTEPGTGRQLIWDAKENAWVPRTQKSANPDDPMKQYEFDGKNYVYTDEATNVVYKFDRENNEWVEKEENGEEAESRKDNLPKGPAIAAPGAIYRFENDTHTYTDPSDGSVYMWDHERNAWFPKIDDDFMARYQMSYGFTEPDASASSQPPPRPDPPQKMSKEEKKAEAKRKAQEPATWFEVDQAHNTAIYVSGLPLDITMEELTELFTKCGLLARDEKGKDKIKLYRDSNGEPKGDALCTYIKVESVDLALKVLDGSHLRGRTLSVQRAKFQLKGEYDPAKKPKKKKKDKERLKKIQEKLFDWRPERMRGEPQKCERVVILKNLFTPEDFDKEVALLLEYQQDIRSECLKCGDVRKVVVYDRHPEGVAQVTFKEPAEAQACIQLLNGRWFGQRKISAEIWDGKTKYKIAETDAEIEARLDKWDKFLEQEDEKKEAAQAAKNQSG